MTWRKRYVYYNFEPYGIAIHREEAERLGIRPVIYGNQDLYDRMPESDRPFYQNIGSGNANWQPEAECRYLGDFELKEIPTSRIRLIVY
jgi:hypothetical protein